MNKTIFAILVATLAFSTNRMANANEVDQQAAGTCNNLSINAAGAFNASLQFAITTACKPIATPYIFSGTHTTTVFVTNRNSSAFITCRLGGYDRFNNSVFFASEQTAVGFVGNTSLFSDQNLPFTVEFVEVDCDVPPRTSSGLSGIYGFAGVASSP